MAICFRAASGYSLKKASILSLKTRAAAAQNILAAAARIIIKNQRRS
jgi:hypothetical protein